MIRTVITVSDYGQVNGGSAKVAIESAVALANIVKESILFCAVGDNFEDLLSKNVKVICLNQYDILNNPNRFKAILQGLWNEEARCEFKKLLQTKNPNETIIHVHSWSNAISSSIFKTAENLGFKVVITIHDYFLACPNGGFYNYKKNHICKLTPLSLKCILCNCDSRKYLHKIWRVFRQFILNNSIKKRKNISYIFISDFSENILTKYINPNKRYRVNNPIEIKNRLKTDAPNNEIYLYIGRLTKEKGVCLFCEVISSLKVKAVVIGDGYLLPELKEKYKDIEFTGWLDYINMRKYILNARCLVFPSLWYECSPLTISEVQAFGIPCIVSDCCAGKDFISKELLFNTNNFESLKEKILAFKNNETVEYWNNKIYNEFNENKFSTQNYIKNLLNVYRDVLFNDTK